MFGDSWQSTYEKRIQVISGGTQIRYWRGDGSAWLFTNNRGWSLTSPPNPNERATLELWEREEQTSPHPESGASAILVGGRSN